jgi:hypothetical protein
MKYLLSFVLSLFITAFSFCQINESAYGKMLDASITVDQYFELYGISKEDLKNIVGSPYDVGFFQPGNIYSNDQLAAPNIPMRYNLFSDEIEINSSFDSQTENINILSKSPNVFVSIANEVYVYVENLASMEESGYFKVVFEGDHFDLYKKSSVTYVEKRFAETNYQQDQPARFDRKDSYFLVNKEGRFFELPSNRRRFLNVFTNHSNEINSFIKSKKLDLRNEIDLTKIITYFNTLL